MRTIQDFKQRAAFTSAPGARSGSQQISNPSSGRSAAPQSGRRASSRPDSFEASTSRAARDVDMYFREDPHGVLQAAYAGDLAQVRRLIQSGASLFAYDKHSEESLLSCAVRSGNTKLVSWLAAQGVCRHDAKYHG